MGGEEFVVVLPNTDATVAIQVAERVRSAIVALQIPHSCSLVDSCVTLSGGVAIVKSEPSIPIEQFIQVADQALYTAKNKGRNRIVAQVVNPKVDYRVW